MSLLGRINDITRNVSSEDLGIEFIKDLDLQELHEITFTSLPEDARNALIRFIQCLETRIDIQENYQAVNLMTGIIPEKNGLFDWFRALEKSRNFTVTAENWQSNWYDIMDNLIPKESDRSDIVSHVEKELIRKVYVKTINDLFVKRLEAFGIPKPLFLQQLLMSSRITPSHIPFIIMEQ